MQGNNCILDANAVLRFLLQDNEEQFRQIKEIIRGKNCYVTLEVLAEVCYVLEGVYQVTREDIACNFRKLVNDVSILNVDILLRGLELLALLRFVLLFLTTGDFTHFGKSFLFVWLTWMCCCATLSMP